MIEKIIITKLFLDLDGVLTDFNKKVFEILGDNPENIPDRVMWPKLAAYTENGGFFNSLEWMPGSGKLWNIVKNFNPTILTGTPRGNWSQDQKRSWVAREMGNYDVITCLSRDKQLHSGAGRLLIDDRKKNIDEWIAMGGEAIFHTSVEQTIHELDRFDLSDLEIGY